MKLAEGLLPRYIVEGSFVELAEQPVFDGFRKVRRQYGEWDRVGGVGWRQ